MAIAHSDRSVHERNWSGAALASLSLLEHLRRSLEVLDLLLSAVNIWIRVL